MENENNEVIREESAQEKYIREYKEMMKRTKCYRVEYGFSDSRNFADVTDWKLAGGREAVRDINARAATLNASEKYGLDDALFRVCELVNESGKLEERAFEYIDPAKEHEERERYDKLFEASVKIDKALQLIRKAEEDHLMTGFDGIEPNYEMAAAYMSGENNDPLAKASAQYLYGYRDLSLLISVAGDYVFAAQSELEILLHE